MEKAGLRRWTRHGVVNFNWTQFESLEKLVVTPSLREKLTRRVTLFLSGEESFHSFRLPWRYGLFFFGPSGCGKTAAGKAIARLLEWEHMTIPAHEILDSHLFERALAEVVSPPRRVIVLEDVDLMVQRMDLSVFFSLLDHAMERAEGTFWIANTRHPENAPKIQLLRPGRFDEAIRLEPPPAELRLELLKQLIIPQSTDSSSENPSPEENLLKEWVEQTVGLTFSHFEELRQIVSRLKSEKADESEVLQSIRSYVDDQLIAGDRWGGVSDVTQDIEERVKHMDARLLTAALDMTDVFRRLMEKVIGDAAEEAKTTELEN